MNIYKAPQLVPISTYSFVQNSQTKMNKYIFFAVFLCALALAKSETDKKEENTYRGSNMADLAIREGHDSYNGSFLENVMKMGETAQEKCPNIASLMEESRKCFRDIEWGTDTVCNVIKQNLHKCYKPAIDIITPCMPEGSKDIPLMVGKMVMGLTEQICSSTVEQILELLNPCVITKDYNTLSSCKELNKMLKDVRYEVPTKSVVCRLLVKSRTCHTDLITGPCKNEVTKNSILNFHDAIENAVKNDCDALNEA